MSSLSREMMEAERHELAAGASRAERQNRPRYLIAMALLLLAVAAIYLVSSVAAWRSASKEYTAQRRNAEHAVERSARFRDLEEQARRARPVAVSSGQDARELIVNAGPKAGLKNSVPVPRKVGDRAGPGGVAVQKYISNGVQDESLEALVRWMETAGRDVPGLEVYTLKVKPVANAWSVDVTFAKREVGG